MDAFYRMMGEVIGFLLVACFCLFLVKTFVELISAILGLFA